jgi:hypothetical protein
MRRTRNPVYGYTVSRVRIPLAPPIQKPRSAGFFLGFLNPVPTDEEVFVMNFVKCIAVVLSALGLSGCTLLAIADAAGSAVVYGVKTTVNVLDAVTPDIVNKK